MAKANEPTSPACTSCGNNPRPVGRFGRLDELCEACAQAHLAELDRISEHYEQHPQDCCCDTYLGRECCLAPIHGDLWRVHGIQYDERFYFDIRAKDRNEAMQIGTKACLENGEECMRVTKIKNKAA